MTRRHGDLAKLLHLVAEVAEGDQSELVSAVYNAARSARTEFSKTKKSGDAIGDKSLRISNDDVVRLENFESRADLEKYIKELYPRRSEVEYIARSLKISVNKTLKYEDLVEKIIDASIGYKLRSRAIRGE